MRGQVIQAAAKEIWDLLEDLGADPREALAALTIVMDGAFAGWEEFVGQPPNEILSALQDANKAAQDHLVFVAQVLRDTGQS